MENEEYIQALKKRRVDEGIIDLSGDIEPGMVESGKMTQQQFDVASRQPGGANYVPETASAASFGHPLIQATGLGLQAIGMIEKARMAKYEMELQRLKDRENAAWKRAELGKSYRV